MELLKKALNEKALMSFITLGYPSLDASVKFADALLENGTDILEVGIPFSDPMADGPTIQAASNKALERGATPEKCLETISKIHQKHPEAPIVVLTYYNLIYRMGVEEFVKRAKQAGVSAILAADLSIEESSEFGEACKKHGIGTVFIVAPNTPGERINEISEHTTSFIYLMARYGITGAKKELGEITFNAIKKLKKETDLPVCVGFGISSPEHVKAVWEAGADCAIVGSAFINQIGEDAEKSSQKLAELSRELKQIPLGLWDRNNV